MKFEHKYSIKLPALSIRAGVEVFLEDYDSSPGNGTIEDCQNQVSRVITYLGVLTETLVEKGILTKEFLEANCCKYDREVVE